MISNLTKYSIFIFFGILLNAQELAPYIENYTKEHYKGDNHVWAITEDLQKNIYFANNQYFIRYNSVDWESYRSMNNTPIRSVFAKKDTIFSGSYQEFGYWLRKDGVLKYHSLSQKNKLAFNVNDEIWKIFNYQNKIFFQSFTALYIYDNKKITKVNTPDLLSYCYIIDDKFYAASTEKGVFEYVKNKFIAIKNWEILKKKVIHGILRHHSTHWFFSYSDGIYLVDNQSNKPIPWQHPLNDILKKEKINCALINEHNLFIGTATNGLYQIDLSQKTVKNFCKNKGLQNNSVLNIFLDSNKNIWLGLENGISKLELNAPINLYQDYTGFLGAVHGFNATIFPILATSKGVFKIEENQFKLIPNTEGTNWDVLSPNGLDYVIGNNYGTFLYHHNQLQKINDVHGGWNLKQIDNQTFIQCTYAGLHLYKVIDKQFQYIKQIDKINKPIQNVIYDKSHAILWATDNYKGIYKITIDDDFNTKSVENISAKNLIYKDFQPRILDYRGVILFLINGNWYEYNYLTNKLELNTIFNDNFSKAENVWTLSQNEFTIYLNKKIYYIKGKNDGFYWEYIPDKYYKNHLVTEPFKMYKQANKLWINLDDAVLKYKLQNRKNTLQSIRFEAFSNGVLLEENPKLSQTNNQIAIHPIFESKQFSNAELYYQIDDNEIKPLQDAKLTFSNQNFGAYEIHFYQMINGKKIKCATYPYRISSPFYLSWWMFLLYFFILFGGLLLYYKWVNYTKNQELKIHENELKHQKNIENLQLKSFNEKKINELEKERLQHSIKLKSNELAGKALAIAKQSEIFDSIKNVLDESTELNIAKKAIQKLIKSYGQQTRELEVFEDNLNEAHHDFIQQLTNKYENLTPKDIKLCIYLHMNLSSKEIAPLLNISFRGVELHRYRLRKKLGLNNDENLNNFMQRI